MVLATKWSYKPRYTVTKEKRMDQAGPGACELYGENLTLNLMYLYICEITYICKAMKHPLDKVNEICYNIVR